MFLTADLLLISKGSVGNACGADCGAAAAFQQEIFTFALYYFDFF